MASVPPENINRPIFSPTTPHFFKIILEDTSKDRKFLFYDYDYVCLSATKTKIFFSQFFDQLLGMFSAMQRIPKKFVMKYGEGISNPVCLKLPSGSEWIVELRRWDGEVWFDNGWPEFSKFYSLDCGHWLVFRYEGNSKFNVCIFDKSCTEIEYPLTMPKMELTSHDESRDNSANDSSDDYGDDLSYKSGDGSDDNSAMILDKFLPCPRKTREKSTLPYPQPHKKRITSSSGKCDFPTEKYGVPSSTPSGEVVALRRAIAFKSQNPSFIVVMRLSYINSGLLWLPSKFCKLRPIKESCEVILQVSDGRTWTVDLRYEEGKATFRRGWMDIVCDNNLELGDVCVFVSTSNLKPLFDVFIFRSKEAASCSIDEGKTVPKMEESDQADGDSVQILDDDSTDDSSDESGDEFSEDSDNNSSNGSSDDSYDNSVVIFDKCPPHQRKTSEKSALPCPQRQKKSRTTTSGKYDVPTESGGSIALQSIHVSVNNIINSVLFKSQNPTSFVVSMSPSYIGSYFLFLPSDFHKLHHIKKSCEVILQVSNVGTWPVHLNYFSEGKKAKFGRGWMEVVRDNNLESAFFREPGGKALKKTVHGKTDNWPSHFFKAILEDTSSDRKLKFVKKYGDKLSNPVLLKLPNGSEWPVELKSAWFDNGWPDFSEFYSLRCGHWLVFQYEGNSKFNVFIFDRSCTEIDYPQGMPQMESADQDDDLDDYSTHRGKSTFPCTRPHKKNRTSSSGKDNFPANKRGEGKSNTRRFKKQRPGYVGRMNPLTKNGKATALDRAEVFKSQNPSSFHVAMKPTYLRRFLWLPSEYRNLHLVRDSSKVTLRASDGRTWHVDMNYDKRNPISLSVEVDLLLYTFSLVLSHQIPSSRSCILLISFGAPKAFLPEEIDDRPTFPPAVPHFFKIILNDTSRDKKIKIPPKFVTKYGDNMSNPVFFKVPSALEWKIELRKWDGEVRFENGWQDFSSFYSLDYGHLLVLGYERNSKFRVLILERSCTEIEYLLQNTAEKTDEDEKSGDDSHDISYHESGDDLDVGSVEIVKNHTPCPRKTREKSLLARKTDQVHVENRKANVPAASAKAIALEIPSGFKSNRHPPLKSLPSQFIKKHLNRTVGYVILRVLGGRTWCVKFEQYDTGRLQIAGRLEAICAREQFGNWR
ncbi:unnamed protein product [Malus baccata var. baccata]